MNWYERVSGVESALAMATIEPELEAETVYVFRMDQETGFKVMLPRLDPSEVTVNHAQQLHEAAAIRWLNGPDRVGRSAA